VLDQKGARIGSVHSLWTDDQGHGLFLSLKTRWLFGRNHVVPFDMATVNTKQRTIRLPFTEAKIKDAPSFDEKADLMPVDKQVIYRYFGVQAPQWVASTATTTQQQQAPQPRATAAETTKTTLSSTATAREPLVREGDATLKLSEEELKVGKREVIAGGMRLHKIVRKEVVTQPVELKREKFVVERVPATGHADHAFEDEDVFIPLRREEAVVEKENHVREEIRIHKEALTEKEMVSGEIRKEDIEIDDKAEDRRYPLGTAKEAKRNALYGARV
jgi:uncharacterized protein (TIGR02271 family)